MKHAGDFLRDELNINKLTPMQWSGIVRAMEQYAKHQVQEIGEKIEEMYNIGNKLQPKRTLLEHKINVEMLLEEYGYEVKPPFEE